MKKIIELSYNGDPYGRGFTASESSDGGLTWFYRGDIGSAPRSYWRNHCRKFKIILREQRNK
jgi:hypothetical protein